MKLRIITEAGAERFYDVRDHESIITLGRSDQCDVTLDEKRASRKHCQIEKAVDGYYLVDLKSSNGTRHNGEAATRVKLNLGDRIEVGATVVYFGEPLPARKVAAPPVVAAAGRPAATPAVARAASVDGSAKALKAVFVAAAVIFAVVVGGALVITQLNQKALPDTSNATTVEAVEQADQEQLVANKRREALGRMDKVLASGLDDGVILTRLSEICAEYNSITSIYEELTAKRDEFNARLPQKAWQEFSTVRKTVNGLVAQRFYGDAIAMLRDFRGTFNRTYYQPEIWTVDLRDLSNEVTDGAREYFYSTVIYLGKDRVREGEYHAAVQLFNDAKDINFKSMDDLQALCDAEVRRVNDIVVEIERNGGQVTAETQRKIEEATRDDPENQRSDDATEANRPGQQMDPDKMRQAEERQLLIDLHEHFMASAKREKYAGVKQDLKGEAMINYRGRERQIEGADEEGVQININNAGEATYKWTSIDPEARLDLYEMIKFQTEDDLWGMAIYAYENDLNVRASEICYELYEENEALKPEIDSFMARHLRIPVPAETGFVEFDPRRGKTRFITPFELASIKAQEEIEDLLETIEKKADSSSERAIEEVEAAFERIQELAEKYPEAREGAVAELTKLRDEQMEKIEKMGFGESSGPLAELRRQLDEARVRAKRSIFDERCYPYPGNNNDHGQTPVRDWEPGPNGRDSDYDEDSPGGQPEVTARVDTVKEIWNNPSGAIGRIDPGVQKVADKVKRLIGWIAQLQGTSADTEQESFLDYVRQMANQKLDIKNFARNGTERRTISDDNQIMRDNELGETAANGNEKEHVRLVNEYRRMMGERCLRINDKLGEAARRHSEYMKSSGQFAHQIPGHPDGAGPQDRARRAGYGSGVGENIAMNSRGHTPQSALDAWLHSSGHHRNILNPRWRVMGAGDAGSHWTELFGGQEDGSEPREPR